MHIIFGTVVALRLAGMVSETERGPKAIAAVCALVPVLAVLAGQLGGQ